MVGSSSYCSLLFSFQELLHVNRFHYRGQFFFCLLILLVVNCVSVVCELEFFINFLYNLVLVQFSLTTWYKMKFQFVCSW